MLALVGLFVVAAAFRVLALIFLLYKTVAAWVFAGTTRYRVPLDFVLALLAGAARRAPVEQVAIYALDTVDGGLGRELIERAPTGCGTVGAHDAPRPRRV